jgi:hypothetical protein
MPLWPNSNHTRVVQFSPKPPRLGRSPAEEKSLEIHRAKVEAEERCTINMNSAKMRCALGYDSEAAFAFQLSHEAIIDQIFGP